MDAFDDLPERILLAMERGVGDACRHIQANAKELCPTGSTGQLRTSIRVEVERDANGDVVGVVGTNVEYAPYIEFGTGPVGEASPKDLPPEISLAYRSDGWTYKDPKSGEFYKTQGQPAKPFLYPAFSAYRDSISGIIAKAVRNELHG